MSQRTLSLSIKDVPEDVVNRLRERAVRNHRSLQGELSAIIEQAAREESLSIEEAYQRIRALGFSTRSESASIVRKDRDAR